MSFSDHIGYHQIEFANPPIRPYNEHICSTFDHRWHRLFENNRTNKQLMKKEGSPESKQGTQIDLFFEHHLTCILLTSL